MKALKVLGVIVCAGVLTALGIDASDTLQGSSGTMLGQLLGAEQSVCPEGMREVAGVTFSCVDVYEASPAESCPSREVVDRQSANDNLVSTTCLPQSVPDALPWVFVSRDEAQALCVRSGKRLPTNVEWQFFALGTDSDTCNLDQPDMLRTGESGCLSAAGIHDVVGNVWEWTSAEVINGVYQGRELPKTGYVVAADTGGIAVTTATTSNPAYDDDYFWNETSAVTGIVRGGFYRSQSDGGVYTAHAGMLPTTQGAAIGFRCVK